MNQHTRAIYMQQFDKDNWPRLAEHHRDIELAVVRTPEQMADVIAGAEILIANNRVYDEAMGRLILAHGKDLRWIQFCTAGIERGIRFGMPRGIPVCNIPGLKGSTVAEHAMLLLLASFRRFRDIETARANREWARARLHDTARSLEGLTLVIAGFGSIGQEVARKAKAFDMHVVTVTRAGGVGPTVDEAVTRDRLHEVLPRADALVLCLPVEPDTTPFIGDAEFARMKPEAVLVNVGRGELLDEAALIRALEARQIGGAALDVTTVEPLPPDNPLWRMENVLISPHVSGTGKDGAVGFDRIFAENLARYRSGRPLLHLVDWEKATLTAAASAG